MCPKNVLIVLQSMRYKALQLKQGYLQLKRMLLYVAHRDLNYTQRVKDKPGGVVRSGE